MKINTLLGTLGLAVFSFSQVQAEQIRMAVKENKVACYGNDDDCLLIKTGKSLDWTSFSDNIAGFSYKEGYRYLIIVDKTLKKGSKTDYNYKFVKVLKQEAVAPPPDPTYSQIVDKKWYLSYFLEQDVASEGLTLEFFNDKIALHGVCNNFYAYHTVNAKTINTGGTVGTMKACSKDDLESKFIKSFDSKSLTYSLNDDNLLLYSRGEHIMTFQDKLENRELENLSKNNWKLYKYGDSLVTNQSIKTLLSFDPESSKFSGKDGCNNYFGTFSTLKNYISFSETGTTRKACTSTEASLISNVFNRLFSTPELTFSFHENRLYFHNNDKVAFIFEKVAK